MSDGASPYDGIDPDVLARAQAQFKATPLHALLGLDIRPFDEERGVSVVDMPITPGTFGSTGNVHGGAIATLVDVACASAAARSSSFVPGQNTIVTADMHVRYLARPKGQALRCEGRVVRSGRSLVVVEGRILDELDTLVAVADFAAMVVALRAPLMPELQTDRDAPEM